MERASDLTTADVLGDTVESISRYRGDQLGGGRGSELTLMVQDRKLSDSPWRFGVRDPWGAFIGSGMLSSALVPSSVGHGVARVEASPSGPGGRADACPLALPGGAGPVTSFSRSR